MPPKNIPTQIMAQASLLAGSGLFMGIATGVAAVVLGGGDAPGTRDVVALGYYALGVVLALAFLLSLWLSVDDAFSLGNHHRPSLIYTSLPASLLTTLAVVAAGVLGASFFFFFPAFGFPALLPGLGSVEFQQGVIQQIGLPGLWFVLGMTGIVALVAVLVVHHRSIEA